MTSHLRANLILVGATLLLSSILYPLTVYGIGWIAFRDKSEGSIIKGKDGQPVGSELIAQEFKGDEYFQPRPSAASYNAAASSASNWGANNPKLRGRIAVQLGPIVRFYDGDPVGPVVEKWFHEKPDRLVDWAALYPTLASAWVKPDPSNTVVTNWLDTSNLEAGLWIPAFVPGQLEKHAAIVKAWKEKHPDAADDVAFYAIFAEEYPGAVPSMSATAIVPVTEGSDMQGWFFDMWLQAHPEQAANIDSVPADMVTASGSGLDPHITLRNAKYQLPRVAKGWKDKNDKLDETKVREEIARLLNEKKFKALGVAGEDLVNVLEVNLALRERYGAVAR